MGSALLRELFGDIVISVRIHTHNLTQDVVEKKTGLIIGHGEGMEIVRFVRSL